MILPPQKNASTPVGNTENANTSDKKDEAGKLKENTNTGDKKDEAGKLKENVKAEPDRFIVEGDQAIADKIEIDSIYGLDGNIYVTVTSRYDEIIYFVQFGARFIDEDGELMFNDYETFYHMEPNSSRLCKFNPFGEDWATLDYVLQIETDQTGTTSMADNIEYTDELDDEELFAVFTNNADVKLIFATIALYYKNGLVVGGSDSLYNFIQVEPGESKKFKFSVPRKWIQDENGQYSKGERMEFDDYKIYINSVEVIITMPYEKDI